MSTVQSWCMIAAIAVTQSAGIITSDAWILAKAAQGETGLLFPTFDAEEWVMWTVKNRVISGEFPDDYWFVVVEGYNGHRLVDVPNEDMLLLAQKVIDATDDPTNGSLYVFSVDDIENFNLSTDEAIRIIENGRWGLYFFQVMPNRKGKSNG